MEPRLGAAVLPGRLCMDQIYLGLNGEKEVWQHFCTLPAGHDDGTGEDEIHRTGHVSWAYPTAMQTIE